MPDDLATWADAQDADVLLSYAVRDADALGPASDAPVSPRLQWVSLARLVGHASVPADAAAVIARAVARMVEVGDVSPTARWQAIEFWAANYLAGPS